jgi:hypothetical protein
MITGIKEKLALDHVVVTPLLLVAASLNYRNTKT